MVESEDRARQGGTAIRRAAGQIIMVCKSPVHPATALALLLAFAAAVLLLGGIGLWAGFRLNLSPSVPIGVYRISDQPVRLGGYVLVCPPATRPFLMARSRKYIPAGFCADGGRHLIKHVAATAGDLVDLTDREVRINGLVRPNSARLTLDGAGRPLPKYPRSRFRLRPREIFLLSGNSPAAFDGRYFGPLELRHVVHTLEPVLIFPAHRLP